MWLLGMGRLVPDNVRLPRHHLDIKQAFKSAFTSRHHQKTNTNTITEISQYPVFPRRFI
ncbi:hypothetical protein NEOLEDRAFT_1127817 [Neolentinus lepideus HHB14362 ss-1]|uniref:Uncharacterized protein n=1 Tax=Neolentinus lepideus HHB14362 ss-1 TaxID=1314782 RepID=A0A165VMV2_9AGAM|nr:hypothetical protein NEOLEDRAFT_1127817 [Neolentinus lepideus HHB14362 ss-1]